MESPAAPQQEEDNESTTSAVSAIRQPKRWTNQRVSILTEELLDCKDLLTSGSDAGAPRRSPAGRQARDPALTPRKATQARSVEAHLRDRDRNVCDAPGRPKPSHGAGAPPERDVDSAQERMDEARDEPELQRIERPSRKK